ncbi:MAG: type I-E CRISPR-associated protein Cse2/CasB [Candidatus Omnitrophica bacterium]|nr:type I-E CRISPR-associated protein Cse2/CasB [Candidatus Omnitrophota bacterium]
MGIRRFDKLFDPDDESGKILFKWWKELEDGRGDRAQLRRARDPAEVVFVPAYHHLYHQLRLDREALACVAGLCAQVKDNNLGKTLAEQMAEGVDKAKVSGLRFRRLLRIDDRDELYNAMRRMIQMLGGVVNIYSLAKTAYWWNQRTKKQLAYEYYEHAPGKEQ